MAQHFAILRCSLCNYSANNTPWTSFHAVLGLRRGEAILTSEESIANVDASFGEATFTFGDLPTLDTITIRLRRSNPQVASTSAYLLHTICLQIIRKLVEDLSPLCLLLVCRALEQEWGTVDTEVIEACVDSMPIFLATTPLNPQPPAPHRSNTLERKPSPSHAFPALPHTHLDRNQARSYALFTSQEMTLQENPKKNHIRNLPFEVVCNILSYLDSKSAVSYFTSCWSMLLSAREIPAWRDLSLFISPHKKISDIVIEAYYTFNDGDYACLDALQDWLQELLHLGRVLKLSLPSLSTPIEEAAEVSFEHRTPLGHRELAIVIPGALLGWKVYTTPIRGKKYVCGLEGIPHTICGLIGEHSSTFRNIYFQPDSIDNLGFVVDSLGIRSLRIGRSEWSSGTPSELAWFEGIDIAHNGTREMVVFADALKFRRIQWRYHQTAKPLTEALIMKPSHIGIPSPNNYAYRSKELLNWSLESFKTIPTESVTFDQNVQAISARFGQMNNLIGLCVYSSDRIQTSGHPNGLEIFFPLQSRREMLNRIDVRRDRANKLALVMYTTLGRKHLFGTAETAESVTYQTLYPLTGQIISGCCLQFTSAGLESIGLVCSPGSLLAYSNSNIPPILTMPSYGHSTVSRFEFCARLDNVQQITTFNSQGFCIGLRISYHGGGSEVLGRLQAEEITDFNFSNEEYLIRLRVRFDLRGMAFSFETNDRLLPSPPMKDSLQVDIYGKKLAIFWWLDRNGDHISFYDYITMEEYKPYTSGESS